MKLTLIVGDPGDRSVGINPSQHTVTVEISDSEYIPEDIKPDMVEDLKKLFKSYLTDHVHAYAMTKEEYENLSQE